MRPLATAAIGLLALVGSIAISVRAQSGDEAIRLTRDLPALTTIKAGDMQPVRTHHPPPAAVVDLQQVLNRVTARPLPQGTLLTEANARMMPADSWLLAVPLGSYPRPEVGNSVVLLGLQQYGNATLVSDRAVVESLSGSEVVVALSRDEARVAASYLTPPRQIVLAGQ